jgi:putative peptidoglycan lipid II flippase
MSIAFCQWILSPKGNHLYLTLALNFHARVRSYSKPSPLERIYDMTENTKVTRAAGVVGTATFLSRVFGFVRDVVIAGFFGAGLASDAFFVAFRIPNLLRRLFAEGSLTVAFIPVFSEYLTRHGREEAFKLARSAMRMLSVILAAAAVVGILAAP